MSTSAPPETTLAAVHGVLAPHRYPQEQITEAFAAMCLGTEPGTKQAAVRRLHTNTTVATRHLALPLDRYATLADFTEANDAFIEIGTDMAAQAVTGALDQAGIDPAEVDMVMSTTVTGVAVPSLEARIAGQVGFRPDVKRVPLFGLGCLAGAAGVARLHDYLLGHPDEVAVLVSVELCSLTVQRGDQSMANLVSSGLFGDGGAAVVAVGANRAARTGATGPVVLDSRSHLYPETGRTMGWDVGSGGLRIVLGAEIPTLVARYLGVDVKQFLADHALDVGDVGAWVSHPGGPKVIQAIEAEIGAGPDALAVTWSSLAEVGNLSSASVLHVLRDTLRDHRPESGTPGVMMAMGPGFCAELVLLRW